MNGLRDLLHDLILEAGRLAMDYRARLSTISVTSKDTERDLVTEADKAVEAFLVGEIRKRCPDHGFFGEEGGEVAGSSGSRWIIDPIDGTASFVHGQPTFSISVALEERGRLVLGAVHAPAMGELFEAGRGAGAFRGGRPVRVSSRDRTQACILSTGFACLRDGVQPNNLVYLNALLPDLADIRRTGSAALDLAWTACGLVDGYWEMRLKLYDIAAGRLLVEEAGGRVSDFSGAEAGLPGETLATNGLIHDRMLEGFRRVGSKGR